MDLVAGGLCFLQFQLYSNRFFTGGKGLDAGALGGNIKVAVDRAGIVAGQLDLYAVTAHILSPGRLVDPVVGVGGELGALAVLDSDRSWSA